MGLKLSIEHANWLAHKLQPSGPPPRLKSVAEEQETLQRVINYFENNFTSFHRFHYDIAAHGDLALYSKSISWVALILPSGGHPESDRLLTDSKFFSEIVRDGTKGGLVLQLEQLPEQNIVLEYVFPALKIALAEVTRWPGVLVWTATGEAAFFELSREAISIQHELHWLLSQISSRYPSLDLLSLKQQYSRNVLNDKYGSSLVQILHLSDLHLGCQLARQRLSRVQTLIESVIKDLDEKAPIIPVITGDLMDTPRVANLGDVRSFITFLNTLSVEKPIILIGNHDVRKNGWLAPQFEQAVNISRTPVSWMEQHKVGIVSFNSVNGGNLARGLIGEQELLYVGSAIDNHPEMAKSFTMIAALHHHPIPVKRPVWYRQAWYDKLFGYQFENTLTLKDSERFLNWLKERGISIVLHGHKHIPRYDMLGDLAIIGCGSTVGKVNTCNNGETYMSINIVTIDHSRGLIGCRLCAERIPGAGLEMVGSHELIIRSKLSTPVNRSH